MINLEQVVEMEKFVLSAMQIREGECVPQVMKTLDIDDFYRPRNRVVYRTTLKIYNKGTAPNILSLMEELQKTDELEAVSIEFLYMLTEYANTTAYVPAYCKSIKEQANLRRLQTLGEKLANDAQKSTLPINEIITAVTTEFSAITGAADVSKISVFGDYFNRQIFSALTENSNYSTRKNGFTNIDEVQPTKCLPSNSTPNPLHANCSNATQMTIRLRSTLLPKSGAASQMTCP